jgi:site-specific DNA-methyltransferase (adenine-specific)
MALMARYPDNHFDLIVTSPPYDGLRDYESVINPNIFKYMYDKLKQGGVICWNVFDEKNNGSYSATSLKQVLKFLDVGFNLHQYLIYEKNSVAFNAKKTGKLYTNIFEFVFVFSKGEPNTVNLICDKKNKYAGQSSYDGKVKAVAEFSPRTTIWKYTTSQNDKTGHPAVMPEKLAIDLLRTYSNKDDVVLDVFSGSGTTVKASYLLDRHCVACELDKEYYEASIKRIENHVSQIRMF